MSINETNTERMQRFLNAVYAFMGIALLITAAVAYFVATVPAFYSVFIKNPLLLSLVMIAQLVLVIVLSIFISRIPFAWAIILYFAYAISVGISFSLLFLMYDVSSIFKTFLVTAGMFGAISFYGFITKSDLTAIGNIATMALFGLIIALLVNLFFKSEQFDYILSIFGVVIFTALTAYDTQKIKKIAYQLAIEEDEPMGKVALMGALTLYLDFINLFLFMLQFMGASRKE